MAFLRAFTDDSAAQRGDRRLFLAGYLHRADVWASFSDHWHAELKSWPAIEYFKASEANNLSGQFDYKKGWDEVKRNAKTGMLAAIIRHDADGARAAMRMHLSNSRERLRHANEAAEARETKPAPA